MSHRALPFAFCLLTACAPPEPEVPSHACVADDDPACASASRDVAVDPFGGRPEGGSFVANSPEAGHAAPWSMNEPGPAQLLSQPRSSSSRPPPRGRHDVRLHQARLDDAVRLLAHEGDFNVVIQGDLPQTVTVDLRNVDPYEALLVLTETHGVQVQYRNGIVTVGAPSSD